MLPSQGEQLNVDIVVFLRFHSTDWDALDVGWVEIKGARMKPMQKAQKEEYQVKISLHKSNLIFYMLHWSKPLKATAEWEKKRRRKSTHKSS